MANLAIYFATLIVFAGVDFVWLGFVAQGYYRSQIGHLIADQVNMGGAVAFYLIYVLGLLVFVVQPAATSVHPTGH